MIGQTTINLKNTKRFYSISVGIYIFIYSIIHLSWIYNTDTAGVSIPPFIWGKDATVHLALIAKIFNTLKNNGLQNSWHILTLDLSYPPLYHFIVAISQAQLKELSYFIMRVTTMSFGLLLLILTFKYAKESVSPKAGFFSCILLSLYPQFYNYFSIVTPHMPLTLMIFLSIYLLFKSKDFGVRKYSIFFGIIFGISLFVKQEAFLYISLPMVYVVIKVLKNRTKQNLLNLLSAVLIFFIFLLPFFFLYIYPQDAGLIHRMSLREHYEIFEKGLLSSDSLMFYLRNLFKIQLNLVFGVLFLIAMPFFLKMVGEKYLLFVCIFAPLVILTFIPAKWPEYSMPILPAVAIISAVGLFNISRRKVIYVVVLIISISGMSHFDNVIYQHIRNYQSRYKNANSYTKALKEIIESLQEEDAKEESLLILDDAGIGFVGALNCWAIIRTKKNLVRENIFGLSYPKPVIKSLKRVNYVLYLGGSKDYGWPSLRDIKRKYGELAILDENIKDADLLQIVDARHYFSRIKTLTIYFNNRNIYLYLYKNKSI